MTQVPPNPQNRSSAWTQPPDGNPADAGCDDQAKTNGSSSHASDPADAAKQVAQLLGQIMDMAAMWLATRLDLARLKLFQWLMMTILVLMGLMVLLVAVIVGTIYLLQGLALGLTDLSGGHAWIGYGGVGLLLLGGIALAGWGFMRRFPARFGQSLGHKYARWQQTHSDRAPHA